jgi:hypothetical protein
MSIANSTAQGRAPSLYDEQLQRQQQERKLFSSFGTGDGGGKLGLLAEGSRSRETGGRS